jgi:hypothetical protein
MHSLTVGHMPPLFAGLCLLPGPAWAQNDWFPRWSPDGSRIVFTSEQDGDPEIYLMQADGTGGIRLTTAPGRDRGWRGTGAGSS